MTTDPPQPIAAQKTQIYFRLSPADGLEKYIGVWAHMLAASDDLIDYDPHASVHRRWRSADPVQPGVPARADVSHLGAVPAQGRREHGAFRRAGQGVGVAFAVAGAAGSSNTVEPAGTP